MAPANSHAEPKHSPSLAKEPIGVPDSEPSENDPSPPFAEPATDVTESLINHEFQAADGQDDPELTTEDELHPEFSEPPAPSAPLFPAHRSIEVDEDTSSEPTDFTPYLDQLAPSTRKILKEEFHANFIHLIRPRRRTNANADCPETQTRASPST